MPIRHCPEKPYLGTVAMRSPQEVDAVMLALPLRYVIPTALRIMVNRIRTYPETTPVNVTLPNKVLGHVAANAQFNSNVEGDTKLGLASQRLARDVAQHLGWIAGVVEEMAERF